MTRRHLKLAFMLEIQALKNAYETELQGGRDEAELGHLKTMIQCWQRAIRMIDEPDPVGMVVTNADKLRGMDDEALYNELVRLIENAMTCPVCWNRSGRAGLRLHLETEAMKERMK